MKGISKTQSFTFTIGKGKWLIKGGHRTVKAIHHFWHTDDKGKTTSENTKTLTAGLNETWTNKGKE